jgi:predicted phage baseplate assembly protein
MPLELPNLDDRDFEALLQSANTDWNDLTPGDPGVVLLEAFAYLTEQLLYRLNRLPDKAYVAFLRLLGVTLNPPTAAWVKLKFWHSQEAKREVLVPRGTRISVGGSAAGQLHSPGKANRRCLLPPTKSAYPRKVPVRTVRSRWKPCTASWWKSPWG